MSFYFYFEFICAPGTTKFYLQSKQSQQAYTEQFLFKNFLRIINKENKYLRYLNQWKS